MLRGAALAILIAIVSGPAAAAIISTFDVGLDGWSNNPADDPNSISHVASGGNPGGYLQIDDTFGENRFQFLVSPSAFSGNLTAFDGGELGFDAKLFIGDGFLETEDFFGVVRIIGTNAVATRRVGQGLLPTQWTSYSSPLTSGLWGVDQAEWLSILSNVQSIEIDAEPVLGPTEVLGFDNIFLAKATDRPPSVIPLPPTIASLGLSIFLLWGWLRRH